MEGDWVDSECLGSGVLWISEKVVLKDLSNGELISGTRGVILPALKAWTPSWRNRGESRGRVAETGAERGGQSLLLQAAFLSKPHTNYQFESSSGPLPTRA